MARLLLEVEGTQYGGNPVDKELANVFTDCPCCGREEFFLVFRDQTRAVVSCQFGHQKYILKYVVPSAAE